MGDWNGGDGASVRERGGSIPTDAPPRWSDASSGDQAGGSDAAVTRAIENRLGLGHPLAGSGSGDGGAFEGARSRTGMSMGPIPTVSPAPGAEKSSSEVLAPRTLPPGSGQEVSAMQEFCGSVGNWGPIIGAHFSPCFIHSFLFAFVDVAFVAAAAIRLKDLLSLPPPPPRALSRKQLFKAGGAALVAVYNLVMFAVHLAYDYGAPYQWVRTPTFPIERSQDLARRSRVLKRAGAGDVSRVVPDVVAVCRRHCDGSTVRLANKLGVSVILDRVVSCRVTPTVVELLGWQVRRFSRRSCVPGALRVVRWDGWNGGAAEGRGGLLSISHRHLRDLRDA
jgi:hypothetical protein